MPIHGYPGNIITANPTSPSVSSASGVWTTEQQMQAIAAGNWPMPLTQISRSLRFNSADSAYLNRTPASAGNRKTWTWSGWVKRGLVDTNYRSFFANGNAVDNVMFWNDTSLAVRNFNGTSYDVRTTQLFRDPSAWYHLIIAMDTTQATASNRIKIYVNGVQVTAFAVSTYPSQNYDTGFNTTTVQYLGYNEYNYFDGYMTEVNFIDGQALTPASFGVTDPATGVWGPRQYTGPYGTNGFYLNFSDNSGTTSTTLGKDYSGNGNNWTPNNFSVTAGAGNDSLVDTPTPYGTDTGAGGEVRGNYCTLNPLDKGSAIALANGNLDIGSASNPNNNCRGTFGMSSGKWYFEFVITSAIGGVPAFGIGSDTASLTSNFSGALYLYLSNGTKAVNGVETAYGATFTQNDVIGVAFDADNNSITFYKNNSSQGAITGVTSGLTWRPFVHASITATITSNFGQRPFAYTAPSGFKALCTQNLPTPTIGATSATQANKYFDVVLRTSNGNVGGTYSTTVNMSNGALLWDKARSINSSHYLLDSVRGISKTLSSDTTGAEANYPNWFTNFGSSSFTTGSDDYTAGTTVVDWIWAANGSGSSNTAGTISSTVSANTTAGFSIVTYTGNGTSGATVGHGCLVNGAATTPSMVILKRRDAVSNWQVKHVSLNANQNLELNSTAAVDTAPGSGYISAISSTTLTLLNGGSAITNVNANTGTYLVYCFAPVAGYSAFGSYTGNGSTDGPFIYTGFRPEWILIKPSSLVDSWQVEDAARSPFNTVNDQLFPNTTNAEQVDSPTRNTDFLSNGFKIRGTNGGINQSSATYIYAAFAEFPFKYTLAR